MNHDVETDVKLLLSKYLEKDSKSVVSFKQLTVMYKLLLFKMSTQNVYREVMRILVINNKLTCPCISPYLYKHSNRKSITIISIKENLKVFILTVL